MLTVRAVLAAALLAYCVGALSQPPPPSSGQGGKKPEAKSANSKQAPAAEQRGTKELPLIIEVLPALKSQEQTEREHYEHHEKPTLDRWLTYATVALAVVTTFLAIFTYFLWGATRKLVIGTKDTAERQLRAYVFVKSVSQPSIGAWYYPKGVVSKYRATLFDVDFVNRGNTPAIIKQVRRTYYLGDTLPRGLPEPAAGNFVLPDGLVIAANEGWTLDEPLEIICTEDQVADLKGANIRLFIIGKMLYRDILGENRETGYCWEFRYLGNGDPQTVFCRESDLNYTT